MKKAIALALLLLSCISYAAEMTYEILSPYKGMKTDKPTVLVKAKVQNVEMALVNGYEVKIKNDTLYKVVTLRDGQNTISIDFIGNGQSVSEYYNVYSDVPLSEYVAEITIKEEPVKLVEKKEPVIEDDNITIEYPKTYEHIEVVDDVEDENAIQKAELKKRSQEKKFSLGISSGYNVRDFREEGSLSYFMFYSIIYFKNDFWILPDEVILGTGSGDIASKEDYLIDFTSWTFGRYDSYKVVTLELRKYFDNILYRNSFFIGLGANIITYEFKPRGTSNDEDLSLNLGYQLKITDKISFSPIFKFFPLGHYKEYSGEVSLSYYWL